MAGSIFVMFIYNLALYFAFRKEQASLYFALVCLLVSIRTISLDEYLIQEIIPISWFWVIKVEYLTYYITVLAFQEFAIAIFKRNFYWLIAYISRVIISIFIAIVLFSPTTFYTSILIYFHSITLLLCFYFFTVLIREMSRRFHQTKYYFLGWIFLFITLLNDVLYNLHVIETGNFGALGTFIFMGFYTYILTQWIASIYERVEGLNLILQNQKEELEQKVYEQTQDLEEINQELEKANQNVRTKNKNIESSIRYAKRIQDVILPSQPEIKQYFPDSFIFYQPRDIVSGDFYWFGVQGRYIFLAVLDCTGHGIPGAFMSMMANDLLREIVHQQEITDTSEILAELHERVFQSLNISKDGGSFGIDIALIAIHTGKKTMEFVGANRPLYFIQRGKFKQISGERISLGSPEFHKEGQRLKFKKHLIYLNSITEVYLFSDGLQVQFGGPKYKKFMSKRLRKLIHLQHQLPMEIQKHSIEQSLDTWLNPSPPPPKPYEQIDDILVMGVRIDLNSESRF